MQIALHSGTKRKNCAQKNKKIRSLFQVIITFYNDTRESKLHASIRVCILFGITYSSVVTEKSRLDQTKLKVDFNNNQDILDILGG